jgi:hypothetical protein
MVSVQRIGVQLRSPRRGVSRTVPLARTIALADVTTPLAMSPI